MSRATWYKTAPPIYCKWLNSPSSRSHPDFAGETPTFSRSKRPNHHSCRWLLSIFCWLKFASCMLIFLAWWDSKPNCSARGGVCFMPTCTNETTRKWLHECEYSNGSGPSIPAEILILSIHIHNIHRKPRKKRVSLGLRWSSPFSLLLTWNPLESPPAPVARCHSAAFRTPRPSAPAPSCQPTPRPRRRRRRGARRRRSRCSATGPSSACLGWLDSGGASVLPLPFGNLSYANMFIGLNQL